MDHSAMIEWVWRYFTDAPSPDADGSSSQPPSLASKLTGPVQLSSEHHAPYICSPFQWKRCLLQASARKGACYVPNFTTPDRAQRVVIAQLGGK